MIYRKIREFYETRFGRIAFIVEVAVIAVWLISALLPQLRQTLALDNLLLVIVLFFVLDTLKYIVDLRAANPVGIRVFHSHAEADVYVRSQFSNGQKPKSADFILFAANSADPMLRMLRDCGAKIRLLLHDPSNPLHDLVEGKPHSITQTERISVGLGSLQHDLFRDYSNAKVLTYARPPSIRGMLIDNRVVAVNWYLYNNTALGLEGQGNPMIVADRGSPEGALLADMFANAFRDLAENSESIVMIPGAG